MRFAAVVFAVWFGAQGVASLPPALATVDHYLHSAGPYHDVTVTDADLNAYWAGVGNARLPKEISQVHMTLEPNAVLAIAHLNVQAEASLPLVVSLLFAGEHTIAVQVHVDSAQAPKAQLTVTSVTLDGRVLPDPLIDAAIAVFIRPKYPQASRTFEIPLPAHATAIEVLDGHAVIHYPGAGGRRY